MQRFPEIDRAAWFALTEARQKSCPARRRCSTCSQKPNWAEGQASANQIAATEQTRLRSAVEAKPKAR